jgi:S-adenosylmethionine:tRNA ribosyltransferase-isomerase
MRTDEFDYDLHKGRIAQSPLPERDAAKMLVLNRSSGAIEHRTFRDLESYIQSGDLVLVNDSRVAPARLLGRRDTGGKAEVLLLEQIAPNVWKALVRPGQRIKTGRKLLFAGGSIQAVVTGHNKDGSRNVSFSLIGDSPQADLLSAMRAAAEVPLPPYITNRDFDIERYQTVFSAREGSLASSTAGLHFTPEYLDRLEHRGVKLARITLHVSIGTFRPIRSETIDDHKMYPESICVSEETASLVNLTKRAGSRVFAVGTTVVRALESAAVGPGEVEARSGETRLFISPGFQFKVVDALLTNFHLPRSTLIVLVSAFAGIENVRRAYAEAVERGYRFLSLGDAMLIL